MINKVLNMNLNNIKCCFNMAFIEAYFMQNVDTTVADPGGGPPTLLILVKKDGRHVASFASHRAPSDKFLDPLLH